jgi:2-oxoglutarate ferredoxin oxidoreductase subunit delta
MALAQALAAFEPGQSRDSQSIGSVSFSPLLIATDRCKACELCVVACPKGLLAIDTGSLNTLGYHPISLHDPERCTSCALCARVCPDAVFEVYAPPKTKGDQS